MDKKQDNNQNDGSMAVVQHQQLAPMTPDAAKEMMQLYQDYQKALLDEFDYQDIAGKKFKKKSAWRKFAMANNLSVRVVDERREELPYTDYAYHFVCEATHPNGRITSGSGSCTAYEKSELRDGEWMNEEKKWNGKFMEKTGKWIPAKPNSLHNVRSTAETRAWNRAVSNMIAAGEVSAEEADQENNDQYHPTATKPESTQTQNSALPSCPECKGGVWDQRMLKDGGTGKFQKTNPSAPDFKCKDKACGGVIWPPKQGNKAIIDIPAPTSNEVVYDNAPMPWEEEDQGNDIPFNN